MKLNLHLTNDAETVLSQCPDGAEAYVLANLAEKERDIIHICHDSAAMVRLKNQLEFFSSGLEILVFPGWDCLPYDRTSPHPETTAQRIKTLSVLERHPLGDKPRITIVGTSALVQRLIPRDALNGASLEIVQGQAYERDKLIEFLTNNGYSRRETVREWGEFAVRGGIIDIFPPGQNHPLRVDFFDDDVESIKVFDPLTQISERTIGKFELSPMGEVLLSQKSIALFRERYRDLFGAPLPQDYLYKSISEGRNYSGMEHWLPLFYDKLETIFDYLPHAAISMDYNTRDVIKAKFEQIDEHYQTRKQFNDQHLQESIYNPVPEALMFLQGDEIERNLKGRKRVVFSPFAAPSLESVKSVDLGVRPLPKLMSDKLDGSQYQMLAHELIEYKKQKKRVLFSGLTPGSAERLAHLLADHDIKPLIHIDQFGKLEKDALCIAAIDLKHGFLSDDLVIITEEDILGERIGRPQKSQKRSELFIQEASSLNLGDLVVHADHGVGRYNGLITIKVEDVPHDCLEIEYADSAKLFLPVENIEILSKYGSDEGIGQLDRLGGTAWQARKAKAKKRIREIAEHLIQTAAQRQIKKASIVEKTDGLFDEFCASFPYVETEDQARAIDDIVTDLGSGRPMDRLICGDVGFGKTEVAMRAAFMTAASGKQVAVIVPTTLLARQHYLSFEERFRGTHLKIAQLSRLVSTALKKKTMEALERGDIDIVIGTSALFADSLKFKDLGLLIIDEEQHFGVSQKEKLKNLKSDIHVLTLTATPIPRTLQMSLSGVREMSLITTPPIDRMAVRTFVTPFDGMVIREAILRERFRGGQSFYVAPKIKDIDKIVYNLRQFIPEVSFEVATGQTPPRQLEEIMSDFCDGKYDVLVSTNIIESGIDIPRANTMIIHNSHMFGLAQLYQLRGRVGRAKLRGYAYLTLPESGILTGDAQKRLQVMQSLDSLGAGFTIASHDMDIRGTGNLLGEEQSGHIREVGVELYQQMLEEAIESMKGEEKAWEDSHWTPQINLGIPVLIPDVYVADLGLRLGLYRRASHLGTREEIDAFAAELIDRFGTMPEEVYNFLEVIYIKALAKTCGIAKIDAGPKGIIIDLYNKTFRNPAGLVHYIGAQRGTAKIRPDQSIVFIRTLAGAESRITQVRRIIEEIMLL